MPVNRNCNLILILINKEMKLFSLINLIQRTMFHSQIKFVLLNFLIKKHLGIVLKSILNYNSHVHQKIKKCNKLTGLKRRVNLPRNAFLTICQYFLDLILAMVIFCMVNQIMRISRKSTTQCMPRKDWCNTRYSKRKSL